MVSARATLTLFVYGTLKRGGRYHDRFARGVRAIEAASVRGRLYMLPKRYPVMIVPPASILAEGSADLLSDAANEAALTIPADANWVGCWVEASRDQRERRSTTLNSVGCSAEASRDQRERFVTEASRRDEGRWEEVKGELLVFDDPEEHVPAIDELEGFRPHAESFYRRVLVVARRQRDGAEVQAWAYVEGEELRAR